MSACLTAWLNHIFIIITLITTISCSHDPWSETWHWLISAFVILDGFFFIAPGSKAFAHNAALVNSSEKAVMLDSVFFFFFLVALHSCLLCVCVSNRNSAAFYRNTECNICERMCVFKADLLSFHCVFSFTVYYVITLSIALFNVRCWVGDTPWGTTQERKHSRKWILVLRNLVSV